MSWRAGGFLAVQFESRSNEPLHIDSFAAPL